MYTYQKVTNPSLLSRRSKRVCFTILALLGGMTVSFKGGAQERFIKELGDRYTRKAYFNSLAIGIVDGDSSKVYTFGQIRPDEPGKPTKDSYYEIGPLTNLFTCLMFQDLVSKGVLDPNDPANHYLPDSIKLAKKDGEPIRLRHLATHTSGLPRLDEDYFYQRSQDIFQLSQNPFESYGRSDLYAFLDEVIPFAKPGEKLRFSTMGIGLLGHILEKAADSSYQQLLARYTHEMGLSKTKTSLSKSTRKRYLLPGFNRRRREVPHWDFQVLAPSGAIKSTPFDMLKFLKLCVGESDNRLADVMRQTQQIRDSGSLKDIKNVKVGYGWFKGPQKVKGKTAFWHNGQTGGFSSFIAIVPEEQQGVVALANTNGGVGGVAFRALRLLRKE